MAKNKMQRCVLFSAIGLPNSLAFDIVGGKSFALGFLFALGIVIADAYANTFCIASSLVIMHALFCGTANFQI